MRPEDVRKLLGGYAAGTLTSQERRALFEAALSDQDLFNELAREQPLKELLEDPRARRELLSAVSEQPSPARKHAGWFGRPMFWAAVGSAAAVVVLVGIFLRTGEPPAKQQPVLVARREAAPAPQIESAPQPPAQKSAVKDSAAHSRKGPGRGGRGDGTAGGGEAGGRDSCRQGGSVLDPPAAGLQVSCEALKKGTFPRWTSGPSSSPRIASAWCSIPKSAATCWSPPRAGQLRCSMPPWSRPRRFLWISRRENRNW